MVSLALSVSVCVQKWQRKGEKLKKKFRANAMMVTQKQMKNRE